MGFKILTQMSRSSSINTFLFNPHINPVKAGLHEYFQISSPCWSPEQIGTGPGVRAGSKPGCISFLLWPGLCFFSPCQPLPALPWVLYVLCSGTSFSPMGIYISLFLLMTWLQSRCIFISFTARRLCCFPVKAAKCPPFLMTKAWPFLFTWCYSSARNLNFLYSDYNSTFCLADLKPGYFKPHLMGRIISD